MGYRDNCGICSESYDNDNLMACSACRREVCYRCTGQIRGLCQRCSDAREAPTAPPPASKADPAI